MTAMAAMAAITALAALTTLATVTTATGDFHALPIDLSGQSQVLDLSAPLLGWSNIDSTSVSSSILADFDCSHSASVLVHWPGLKGTDLVQFTKAMPHLRSAFDSAGQSTHVPHFVTPEDTLPVDAIKDAIMKKCAGKVNVISLGAAPLEKSDSATQAVILVDLNSLSVSSSQDRYDAIQRDDTLLKKSLDQIVQVFPDIVVFLASSNIPLTSHLMKRDQPVASDPRIPYSQRSIFQKYIFFNPALFMGIFVGLLLLIIILVGVRTLQSLQTPTRFETREKDK
ncbi:hypothetical protein BASA81_017191 [Batrachochytrium salamandrivorans]|nr:hypothetical protein BASA62_008672 [Batrachochytrium salamandrivorans]KAH9245345.1 hypothetical protein BASA81_017191 [Batrachochytrium salamandrivorans]